LLKRLLNYLAFQSVDYERKKIILETRRACYYVLLEIILTYFFFLN